MSTLFAALTLSVSSAHAQTADEVLDTAAERNRADSTIQKVRMVLVSKNGSERIRELELKTRREGEVIKSLARFLSPSDVSGTQLLLIDEPDAVDEQLLYLPALKRTNHISGKARSGAFMGSDFSYEDLETSQRNTATHKMVDDAGDVWVIDSNPGDGSQYGRIRIHVSKSDYVSRKVEFFDDDDAPLKVLEVSETSADGDITVPVKSVMRNLKRGTSTRLEVLDQQLNVPAEALPDETFTKAYMERNG